MKASKKTVKKFNKAKVKVKFMATKEKAIVRLSVSGVSMGQLFMIKDAIDEEISEMVQKAINKKA